MANKKPYDFYHFDDFDFKTFDFKPFDFKPFDFKPFDFKPFDFKPLHILLLLFIYINLGAHTIANATLLVNAIKTNQYKVLHKQKLDDVKHFILKTGQTCTYSNRYNNNPCYKTANYQFYLNPDSGGLHNNGQWNINCDPKKSDFNTLVIKANKPQPPVKLGFSDDDNTISTTVKFSDKEYINVAYFGVKNSIPPAAAIVSSAETALKALMLVIK